MGRDPILPVLEARPDLGQVLARLSEQWSG